MKGCSFRQITSSHSGLEYTPPWWPSSQWPSLWWLSSSKPSSTPTDQIVPFRQLKIWSLLLSFDNHQWKVQTWLEHNVGHRRLHCLAGSPSTQRKLPEKAVGLHLMKLLHILLPGCRPSKCRKCPPSGYQRVRSRLHQWVVGRRWRWGWGQIGRPAPAGCPRWPGFPPAAHSW